MNNDDDAEPLMIKGRAVDRGLLEARPMRRCHLDECQSHCCTGGVWIHTRQAEDLVANQDLIFPHLPPERRDVSQWFDGELERDDDFPEAGPVTGTAVVNDPTHPAGTACIFLRPDRMCGLQAASIAAGEHPWRFKPFYCALHPLVLDEGELSLAEDSEIYKEGGSCNRPNPSELIPLYELFQAEVKLVLGEDGYAQLRALSNGNGGARLKDKG